MCVKNEAGLFSSLLLEQYRYSIVHIHVLYFLQYSQFILYLLSPHIFLFFIPMHEFSFVRRSAFPRWWLAAVDSCVIFAALAVIIREPCLTISATCWKTAVLD